MATTLTQPPPTTLTDSARRHGPRLRRYALSLLGDAEAARDAVADVTARCCEPGHAEAGVPRNAAAYLFAAVRHRCLSVRRKERRMSPLTDRHASRLYAADPDPADAAAIGESAARALAALCELPEAQREVLRLKFAGGLSYAEIAGVTGKSANNVSVLCHLGLKKLRAALEAQGVTHA